MVRQIKTKCLGLSARYLGLRSFLAPPRLAYSGPLALKASAPELLERFRFNLTLRAHPRTGQRPVATTLARVLIRQIK